MFESQFATRARLTTPLALAVHIAVASALILGATEESRAREAEQQHIEYDIPAGAPLADALNRFAQQSGVAIVLDARQLAGLEAPGLRGRYGIEEGFAILLRGSGYAAAQTDAGYVLRAVPNNDADSAASRATATLPKVRVQETIEDGVTEGTGSYTTGSTSSATKLALSLKETPQSVTLITRDRMDDQGLMSISDLMQNTPGISITATAPYRESYFARGFEIENYTFDGLAAAAGSSRKGMLPHDMVIYDRVEIVRGAAGLTQGVGTPSAAINFVRKRPTHDFRSYVQAQAGRWNYLGAEVDVSGSLNQAGTVRGRTVAHWHDSDSFQDVVSEGRRLAYVIGEADLTDDTLLTLSFAYQENDNDTTYGGLPTAQDGSDLHLPRSSYFGNPWNYWNDTTVSAFASLEHRFANDWKIKLAANSIWGDQQQVRAGVGLNDNGEWDQSGGRADIWNDRTTIDLSAQGSFEWLGRTHELVFGADLRLAEDGNDTAGYWPPIYFATDVDIYDWNHDGVEPASWTEDYHASNEQKQRGVYGTTRLHLLDPLKLIVGLRADWYEYDEAWTFYDWDLEEWFPTRESYDHDVHLTKYAGVIYDLNAQYSIYASYTDIFKPQREYDINNRLLDPIVGKNYEVGVKAEYFDGALNLSAAVFRIDQDNKAMEAGPCPFNPEMACYRAAGMVRSEGYELEAQGALTANWQIAAGFTYVTTKVERDSDPAAIGTKLNTQLPPWQVKLATTYRFSDRWRVGGNLRWQDDIYHFDDWMGFDYRTEQSAYALVDAMVGFRPNARMDFQLNLYNAFDEVYYSAINAQPVEWGGNTVYGEPRNVMLTARYQF